VHVQRAVARVREADRREVRLCDVLDVSGSHVLAMYGPLKGGATGLGEPTGALVKVCVCLCLCLCISLSLSECMYVCVYVCVCVCIAIYIP
jgi:hypothetical protein